MNNQANDLREKALKLENLANFKVENPAENIFMDNFDSKNYLMEIENNAINNLRKRQLGFETPVGAYHVNFCY